MQPQFRQVLDDFLRENACVRKQRQAPQQQSSRGSRGGGVGGAAAVFDCSGSRAGSFVCGALSRSSGRVSKELLQGMRAALPRNYRDALLDLPRAVLARCFDRSAADFDPIALEAFLYVYVTKTIQKPPNGVEVIVPTAPGVAGSQQSPTPVYYVAAAASYMGGSQRGGGPYLDSLLQSLQQPYTALSLSPQPSSPGLSSTSLPSFPSLTSLSAYSSLPGLSSYSGLPGLPSSYGLPSLSASSYREPTAPVERDALARHTNDCLQAVVMSFNYMDRRTLGDSYVGLVDTLRRLLSVHEGLLKAVTGQSQRDYDDAYVRIRDMPDSFRNLTMISETFELLRQQPSPETAGKLRLRLQQVQLHIFLLDSLLSAARKKCVPATQQLRILPLQGTWPRAPVSESPGCQPLFFIVNQGRSLWLLRVLLVGPFREAPAPGRSKLYAVPLSTLPLDTPDAHALPTFWPRVVDAINLQSLVERAIERPERFEVDATAHTQAPYYEQFKALLDRYTPDFYRSKTREAERPQLVAMLEAYFNTELPLYLAHVVKNTLLNAGSGSLGGVSSSTLLSASLTPGSAVPPPAPPLVGLAANAAQIRKMLAEAQLVELDRAKLTKAFERLAEAIETKKPPALDPLLRAPEVKDRVLSEVITAELLNARYPSFQQFYGILRGSVVQLWYREREDERDSAANRRAPQFDRTDLLFQVMQDIKATWKSYKRRFVSATGRPDEAALLAELTKIRGRYDTAASVTSPEYRP